MNEKSDECQGKRSPAPEQIEGLFGVAAGEWVAITRLTGCLADLGVAQAAQRELAILSAVAVREAPIKRRNSLLGAQ